MYAICIMQTGFRGLGGKTVFCFAKNNFVSDSSLRPCTNAQVIGYSMEYTRLFVKAKGIGNSFSNTRFGKLTILFQCQSIIFRSLLELNQDRLRCRMDLRKFPLDSQVCPLEIGSFGFDSSDMHYR